MSKAKAKPPETVHSLEREARVIRAWLRDVTEPKQERLAEIQAKIEALSGEEPGEGGT